MADLIHHIKAGDTTPPLEAVLTDKDGNPVDLSDIGELRFHMDRGANEDIDAEAEVVDPEVGAVKYEWADGDTDLAGVWRAEFVLTSGGETTTFPNDGYITVVIHERAVDNGGS